MRCECLSAGIHYYPQQTYVQRSYPVYQPSRSILLLNRKIQSLNIPLIIHPFLLEVHLMQDGSLLLLNRF